LSSDRRSTWYINQCLLCSTRADPGGQLRHQAIPLSRRYRSVDALVCENDRAVFEQCQKDEDSGAVSGSKHLLLEKRRLGSQLGTAVQGVGRDQWPGDPIEAADEVAEPRADQRRQRDPQDSPASPIPTERMNCAGDQSE
jgi:hypothetical protein